jgi:predicted Zn-dependent protease with MMP-like domain
MKLDPEQFARLVEQALGEVPAQFEPHLANVVIDIEASPDRETLESDELDDPRELLGLYHGTPLTERGAEAEPMLPDRIVLYRQNILLACESEEEIIQEIRTTVLHEIGHHFGLDEDELDELGYG